MKKSISYQNHQICYYIKGQGEPILFLHGWPTNSRLWNAQVETLQSHYKVITLDWLGFGKSDKPEDYTYTFTPQKEILDILINHLLASQEEINMVAHDIGGPPAILWSHENPKKVKRLILLNTVLFPFKTPLDASSHLFFNIPLLNNVIMSDFGLKILMNTLTQSRNKIVKAPIQDIINWHENLTKKVKLKTIFDPLTDRKNNEVPLLANQFKKLAIQKFLIVAQNDPLCYQHIKKLQEQNPSVPSFTLDNCGHYIPIDQPNQLNEILLKILAI